MIPAGHFDLDPWRVRESRLDLDHLPAAEAIFSLSNGHIGLRANLDEGEPYGTPGTYLNGFYEQRPLPYAETAYGDPEDGQTIVNITDGKLIRLLVDDEPFDVRYGTLVEHERVLDFRQGVLRRSAIWISPAGTKVRITSTRLVSLSQRAVAAIHWTVAPVDCSARVVVQSELVADEPGVPATATTKDPRAAAVLRAPLEAEEHSHSGLRALLVHRTGKSGLRMAAGMDHELSGPSNLQATTESTDDLARTTIVADLKDGDELEVVKFLAYGWSSNRSRPAVRAQVDGALAEARHTGWKGLLAAQRVILDEHWEQADVEVEGDAELQQALRFALFQLLQSGARAEQRAIAAKGLSGSGYDGHSFWDTETFVLPVLEHIRPEAVDDALRWRQATLPAAKRRAQELGHAGAAFPWRTIDGQECSGYWPASTAAVHINADIAVAALQHVALTGDADFERDVALELLVETARLWISLGHHDAQGRFRIDGVTGPDEYTALVDNNVYTNLMAARNLAGAADVAARWLEEAFALGVNEEEMARWRDAASQMFVPYDAERGLHPQSERFLEHARWDFEATPPEQYPLLLHHPYMELYRRQVVKQADLVLAMHLCPTAFTHEQKVRNFAYYEGVTVRDSSLSACTQAVVAAEVGHLDLAYDYLTSTALTDLHDLHDNTKDGLHLASLAGTWLAVVEGLGGLRANDGVLRFAPRLPEALGRLTFRVRAQQCRVLVDVRADRATYTLLDGDELEVFHHGLAVVLVRGRDRELPIAAIDPGPAPVQPLHREPGRRTWRPV